MFDLQSQPIFETPSFHDPSESVFEFIEDLFKIEVVDPVAGAVRNRLLLQSRELLGRPALDRSAVNDFDYSFQEFLRALGPRPELDPLLARLELRLTQIHARAVFP